MEHKKRVLGCYVNSTLLNGSECWTVSTQMEKRLKAAEMWFYRTLLRISWTEHTTDEKVLRQSGNKRSLLKRFRRR